MTNASVRACTPLSKTESPPRPLSPLPLSLLLKSLQPHLLPTFTPHFQTQILEDDCNRPVAPCWSPSWRAET
jgi:hypothetical protein